MEKRTEDLRDLFVSVTDESTVTESQTASRGSLATPEGTERLDGTVRAMRERYDFETDLDDTALSNVVKGFYAGHGDDEIAESVGCSREEVIHTRLELHLVRERDTEQALEFDDLREQFRTERSTEEIARELSTQESCVWRSKRVLDAIEERRRVGDRYRETFEDVLEDGDLASHTDEMTDDGLEEATEGMETNVSF